MDKLLWEPRVISFEGMHIDAWVCSLAPDADCNSVYLTERIRIEATGGKLFHCVNRPELEKVETPGARGIAYKYPHPPVPELWHVPVSTFESIINILGFFRFPIVAPALDAGEVYCEVKALLLEFNKRKLLRVVQIDESFVMVEITNPQDRLEHTEVERIIELNKRCFGVTESNHEEINKKNNWIKKGFFTIGAI